MLVTLRELAARIQRDAPERLGWWNGLSTADRKRNLAQVNAAAKAATKAAKKTAGKKKASRSSIDAENADAFTRTGRISGKDWHELFHA